MGIKQILKTFPLVKKLAFKRFFAKKLLKQSGKCHSILGFTKKFFETKVFYANLRKAHSKLLKSVKIKIDEKNRFFYNIDFSKVLVSDKRVIDNISIDYSKVLNCGLKDYFIDTNTEFAEKQNDVILALESFIARVKQKFNSLNHFNKLFVCDSLTNLFNEKAKSFEESLQRILFIHQLLWQCGHTLIGLGRLDKILGDVYQKDIKNNVITKSDAALYLKDFLTALNKDYYYKSGVLSGDTGQVIILGGTEPNGEYFCNELTYLFVEILQKMHIPEPKVVLRLDEKTPRDLLDCALKSIATGIGSPLFSNDSVVIKQLIDFGFDKEDCFNYCVSACWEPLIAGKSIDSNNISAISFLAPLNNLLQDKANEITDIDSLHRLYFEYLKKHIDEAIINVLKNRFEVAPLLSLFIDNCRVCEKDVSEGGAKYNNYGLTTVGLANTVNSLLNIEKFVFVENQYSLQDFEKLRKQNFSDSDIAEKLRAQHYFGKDDQKVLKLINDILAVVENQIKGVRNYLGGKIKFGYSSPDYIIKSKHIKASYDGRKDFEPLSVHISPYNGEPLTEFLNFVTKLDYSGCKFNGNVADFFVSSTMLTDSFDKFADLIMVAQKEGFFQMQINVVSSQELIDAKNNPNAHKNLIVRVWGFSAYFNDLPDDYKDMLIQRALENESAS